MVAFNRQEIYFPRRTLQNLCLQVPRISLLNRWRVFFRINKITASRRIHSHAISRSEPCSVCEVWNDEKWLNLKNSLKRKQAKDTMKKSSTRSDQLKQIDASNLSTSQKPKRKEKVEQVIFTYRPLYKPSVVSVTLILSDDEVSWLGEETSRLSKYDRFEMERKFRANMELVKLACLGIVSGKNNN